MSAKNKGRDRKRTKQWCEVPLCSYTMYTNNQQKTQEQIIHDKTQPCSPIPTHQHTTSTLTPEFTLSQTQTLTSTLTLTLTLSSALILIRIMILILTLTQTLTLNPNHRTLTLTINPNRSPNQRVTVAFLIPTLPWC